LAFHVYIIVAWFDGNIKIYELPKSQDIWTGILIWTVPKAMSILIWSPYTGPITVHSDILRWFRQDSGLFCVIFRHDFGLFCVMFRQNSSLFCFMFRYDFGLFCAMFRQDSSLLCIILHRITVYFVLWLGRIPVSSVLSLRMILVCAVLIYDRIPGFLSAFADFNVLSKKNQLAFSKAHRDGTFLI